MAKHRGSNLQKMQRSMKLLEAIMVAIACPSLGFGIASGDALLTGIGLVLFFGSYLLPRPVNPTSDG
jgi:hypothetical protein